MATPAALYSVGFAEDVAADVLCVNVPNSDV